MLDEPGKIMARRFKNRFLESGLLIIAVALGVGASAAGLALVANTLQYKKQIFYSPAYREIIVTTRADLEDMATPVSEKPADDDTVLTVTDLSAAEIIPTVTYAYISNPRRLHFLNDRIRRLREARSESGQQVQPGDDNRFQEIIENQEKAKGDSSIIIPQIDELRGFEISTQFFAAWRVSAAYGSLFTESDSLERRSLVLLGSSAAELIAGNDCDVSELIGKKILSMEGYHTITGILEPSGESYDNKYFTPYQDRAAQAGSIGRFRRGPINTTLKFAVTDPADLEDAADKLENWFAGEFGTGNTAISNSRAEAERLIARNVGISLLVMFLSLAGLFIASVNVSHILMSRAIRMRKHVGMLKALGASKKSILKLFAGEAFVITFMGSAAGLLISIPFSRIMQESLGYEGGSILLVLPGVVISWILTMLFSVMPARKYVQIEAAQAMRYAE